MVQTKRQLKNISKNELVEKLISVEDISSKLSDLTSRFDDFSRRYEVFSSELSVSKNCKCLSSEKIVQVKRNAVNNAQHNCPQSTDISPVPASISNEVLESNMCKHFL